MHCIHNSKINILYLINVTLKPIYSLWEKDILVIGLTWSMKELGSVSDQHNPGHVT